jgi:dTDP-glucose 4,6-dehydratase
LAKAKDAVFLLASTSEVMATLLVRPQPEDIGATSIPSGRAAFMTKPSAFAEAMTMAYHRYHG